MRTSRCASNVIGVWSNCLGQTLDPGIRESVYALTCLMPLNAGTRPSTLPVRPVHTRTGTQLDFTGVSSCTVAGPPESESSPSSTNGIMQPESPDYDSIYTGNPNPGSSVTSHAALGTPGGGATSEEIQPKPVEDAEDEDIVIHLPDLQKTQQFVDALRGAVLKGSGMYPEDIENVRNPAQESELIDPSSLLRCVRHFINYTSPSRQHYNTTRKIELLNDPTAEFLSFDQVRRRVRWLSGVVPMEHDMCTRSCVAYTGPYAELDSCPRCGSPRYPWYH
ncbi:hypothetical protein EI94DRAFT_1918513 [Lactarius quietus]|nr:hypothetical protein EI94DRAFT_1918513 [Lactarius quietus]